MKPPKFHYLRPTTLPAALDYLKQYGEDAKILAGGQSLIPVLNMRLSMPEYVIDIGRVPELTYIRKEHDTLVIGTLTRHVDLERSELVQNACPLLSAAIHYVGHPQIRNRGTVGGSIAHADPSAELPCVLTALRGEIVAVSADGERIIPAADFFLSSMVTALAATEMVKEVRFPCLRATSGYAFLELARRHGDFALVEVAAVLDVDESGRILLARLAVGGAHAVPTALTNVEALLVGQEPGEALFKRVSKQVSAVLKPMSDIHGSAEYRLDLAGVLTERALKTASEQMKGRASQSCLP